MIIARARPATGAGGSTPVDEPGGEPERLFPPPELFNHTFNVAHNDRGRLNLS